MIETVGLIGAGNIGGALARLAVAAGMRVVISNTDPVKLAAVVEGLGPRARAGSPLEAAEAGDVVIAAIPFAAHDRLPAEALRGRTVIDTMNYYPDLGGHVDAMTGDLASSVLVARHLGGARVIKAFNTLDFVRLSSLARPQGDPERSGLAIAGDDPTVVAEVSELVDRLGYDPVATGPLADSWGLEPGTPVYVSPYLPRQPDGLDQEEMGRWFFQAPGVVVGADVVRGLVDSAVRVRPGSVQATLRD